MATQCQNLEINQVNVLRKIRMKVLHLESKGQDTGHSTQNVRAENLSSIGISPSHSI